MDRTNRIDQLNAERANLTGRRDHVAADVQAKLADLAAYSERIGRIDAELAGLALLAEQATRGSRDGIDEACAPVVTDHVEEINRLIAESTPPNGANGGCA